MATQNMIDTAATGGWRPPPTDRAELRGQHILAGATAQDGDDILTLARLATARAHNRHGCRPDCAHPRHRADVDACLEILAALGLAAETTP